MRKLIALAVLGLPLAGGVAAVSSFTTEPALACPIGGAPIQYLSIISYN
jgi:hypothetical protein